MRSIKLSAAFLLVGLFITACDQSQPQQQTTAIDPYANNSAFPIEGEGEEYWAKDNFDLQRAGDLLQRSESPEQFERYLNEPDGIDNLDLNGDGYADYIGVREYEDRDTNSRGLSLFSRFGPDLIQEIATVLLYRDQPNYPGARFLLRGNDQLYGDDYYYETNWLDRSIPIASYLFQDRNQYYQSPYYYDNYPTWYQPYNIVETPVYRTRVEQLYPQPAFTYINREPEYFSKIKIKSPNNGLHLGQIHAKLVKPMPDQAAYLKDNPGHAKFAKGRRQDKPGRDNPPRSDRGDERGNPGRDERGAQRGNPDKPDVGGHPNKGGGNPNAGGGNPNKGGGNPNAGGGNPNKGGGPPKADNPNKAGGNPNKGGGGGNPNKGGGNPNKGGGGKGGGKKG